MLKVPAKTFDQVFFISLAVRVKKPSRRLEVERKQEFNGGSSGNASPALWIEELSHNTKRNPED